MTKGRAIQSWLSKGGYFSALLLIICKTKIMAPSFSFKLLGLFL